MGPDTHNRIKQYVSPGPEMYVCPMQDQCIYLVNAENALQWLTGLTKVWSGLQVSLLVDCNSKWQVTEDSPSPHTINDIVMRLFTLEALLPIFQHLLSANQAAAALQNAGE